MRNLLLRAAVLTALGGTASAQQPPPDEKLSHEQIKKTVDSHVADIKACMKENGAVTGKLVLVFGVLPNGHTGDVKVKEASSNAGLDKCIAAGFRKWVFPARKGGPFQGVEYPLVFTAPKPAAPPPPQTSPEEQKQVEGVINSHMPEVRRCYEDGLLEKSDLAGVLNTDIIIAPAGNVADTKVVDNSVKAPKVEKCILDSVKKWTFPKHSGPQNMVVTYPFVLKLENKK